jgi:fibronectin-binding autotransporter adhesin
VASNGTTLNLDISGGATLQTPAATLDGTTINLTYGVLSGSPSQAAINSSSLTGVTLSATRTNVINISGTGFAENGVVPLIDYAGTTIGGEGYAAFKLGPLPIGVSGVLSNDTVNGIIVLHLGQVPAMLTWYGDKSANWDTSTLNWAFGTAAYDQTGGVGDIVTFDDTLEPTLLNTNVVLTTTLVPTILQVNNSTYEYVFSGSGKLSGIGMLTKGGTAALTLLTASDYSGGSYLSNGVVRLGNNAALGTGLVNLLGGVLSSDGAAPRTLANPVLISAAAAFGDSVNSGVLTLAGPVNFNNATRNLTLNSPTIISGGATNGGLFKLGTNTLTFWNCTNTLGSGSSEIRQGTVVLSNALITSGSAFRPACNVAAGEARLVIGNGSVWENSGAAGSFRLGTQGTSGEPTATNIVDIAGELRAPNAAPPNGRFMFSSNYIGFANLLTNGLATVTAVVSEGGTNNTAYQEFNFNGGTLRAMANASTSFMEGLAAAYVRAGGAVVDSDGADITIAQTLLNGGGGGGLTKLGTGRLTLSGANAYTGPTMVSLGTLLVSGDSSAANGNATVLAGATLGGNGTLGAAVTVNLGGTLAPGAASLGTLTLKSTLTLRGAAVMELNRDGGSPTNDVVAGLAGISYGGSLVLTNIGATPLALNDTFVLFSAPPGTYSGAFTNVVVPVGYTFDTNKLTLDGSVKVVGIPSAIPNTPTNIAYSLTGDQLTLSWPANYRGCFLQGQTNLVSKGLSTNWVNVPNSENVTSLTLPVDPTRGSVFFRLRHP